MRRSAVDQASSLARAVREMHRRVELRCLDSAGMERLLGSGDER